MRVHRTVDIAASYAWRLLVIAAAAVGVLWVVARAWVVLAALVVTVLLARILAGPAAWLRRKRLPAGLAALVSLVGFLVLLAGIVSLISVSVAGEVSDLGPTVSAAGDDIEDWVVEDSPFDVSRRDVDEFREGLGDRVRASVRDSSGSIVSGAVLAAEAVVGLLLGLVVTFFALKDGDRFLAWVRDLVPAARSDRVARVGQRAWSTVGGYLRGAAMLGFVEGIVIAVALWLVGADLALPVGVLTFLMAFVPFVGAIVAGVLAVLVALATAGSSAAVIILIVAVVVQQLDNELLAPVVYGRSLDLHPVVILLSIAAGGALLGVAGSVLAVPVTAVVWNVVAQMRADSRAAPEGPQGQGRAGAP